MVKALRGFNPYGYAVLGDRAYGKVKQCQRVEHAGADGAPLSIKIEFVESDGNGHPRIK